MRPVGSTETKPWWYVSALDGVRKQTEDNSEALQRMDKTILSLQKKLKEAVCNMSERCLSLESSCGEFSAKLDSCMTTHEAISGQLQIVKQAREPESSVMDSMDRRMSVLESSYQQEKANTNDFRARLSYEVAQEVGELREALELESATLSASLRILMLDVDFAAQEMTELRQEAGAETAKQVPKTGSASKHGVAGVIVDEPHLHPCAPTKGVVVQKELAQALESHLRCLRGVFAQSSAELDRLNPASQKKSSASASLKDEHPVAQEQKDKILEAQTNQTDERTVAARLGIHSAAADRTILASGYLKDEQVTTAPSRQQQQSHGQPSAGGSLVDTAPGLVDTAPGLVASDTDEKLRQRLQRSSPPAALSAKAAVAAAAAAFPQRRQQPIQAARRFGQQRVVLKSTRPSSAATYH